MPELAQGYAYEINNITKSDWSDIILKFDDANLYQTWEYGAAKWGEKDLLHFILKKDNEVVSAAQIWYKKIPFFRAGFAHISMGPLWRLHGHIEYIENIRNMLSALYQEFVNNRGVLLRIYTYEKNDDHDPSIKQIFESANICRTNEKHDVTILLDLDPNLVTLRQNLRKSWRRQLKQAENNNLKVIEGTSDELFNRLCNIYEEMLNRKKFKRHIANLDLLKETQKNLPPKLKMRIFLCQSDGKIVGGQAVSALGNTGIDIIAAISDEDTNNKLKSTYLFEWQTVKWLKLKGYKFLDLRGYDPERYPGPSYYKAGLNGEIMSYIGIFEASGNLFSSVIVQTGKIIRSFRNFRLKKPKLIPLFNN